MNEFEQMGYYAWDDEYEDDSVENEQMLYYADHFRPEDSNIANKMSMNNRHNYQFYQNSNKMDYN